MNALCGDVWVLLWSMTQWLTLVTGNLGWYYICQMLHPTLCALNPLEMGVNGTTLITDWPTLALTLRDPRIYINYMF